MKTKTAILFVCMGNICRSPTAEGVFRKLAADSNLDHQFIIDSAGTINHHVGEQPDKRSILAAKSRGYDLSNIKSRQIGIDDFDKFDRVLVMDEDNYRNCIKLLKSAGQSNLQDKVKLFLSYSTQTKYKEVPDPYYSGDEGFDRVIDLIEDASLGLLKNLSK